MFIYYLKNIVLSLIAYLTDRSTYQIHSRSLFEPILNKLILLNVHSRYLTIFLESRHIKSKYYC